METKQLSKGLQLHGCRLGWVSLGISSSHIYKMRMGTLLLVCWMLFSLLSLLGFSF